MPPVEYKGETYYWTGKTGTRNRDGQPVAEYATEEDQRIWVGSQDGVIEED